MITNEPARSALRSPGPTDALVSLRWAPPPDGADEAALQAGLESIADRLSAGGLACLQERIYAHAPHVDRVLALRRAVWTPRGLDAGSPVTVIANRGCTEGPCAGVQILAVQPQEGERVVTVTSGRGRGRRLESGSLRAIFLADLRADPDATDPLQQLFDRAVEALDAQGMSLRDVARTWLYVEQLLPTYDHLNRVRDAAFVAQGVKGGGRFLLEPPASTGIQGWHPRAAPCFLDLIAVTDGQQERPFDGIRPALQGEAWAYGSSFSRGMTLELGPRRLSTISGTASIGPRGRTLHVGDPTAQIQETLANIRSLLDIAGLTGHDGLWTMYFKNEAVWQAWRALVDGGVEPAPPGAVAIYGDVCRDDLLFEVEVTVPG